MTDFQARFEMQLIAAARREVSPAHGGRRIWRGRVTMMAFAATAATATALAATHPWSPTLGDQRFGGPRPTASPTAPPPAELRLLGVLRRSQRPDDRGAATREALRYISAETTSGVRTSYVRTLDNGAATLLPVVSHTLLPGAASTADALCVYYQEPHADGGAKSCWSVDDVKTGRATGGLGAHIYGLVPDGVVEVQITYINGHVANAAVADNFYDLDASKDSAAPGSDPRIPKHISSITWLDDHGLPVAKG
jgi:hypothetical protein